jgi:putative flippase GtrA
MLSTILKFAVSGSIGALVDFSITILFKEYFKINLYLSNLLGVLSAIIVLFFLHKRWTFMNTSKNVARQFQQFLIISLLGCALNSGLLYLFQQNFSLPFYLGKFLAIICVGIWNFSANSFITFKGATTLQKSC